MSLSNTGKPLRMDRKVPFVNEVFCILEGAGSESKAIKLLESAEKEHQLELSTIQPYPRPEYLPDVLYPEYIQERLHGFWSTTHLVLGGADASRLFLLFSERYLCTMGIREWGGEMARWANRTAWLSRTEWSFADFTGGPNDLTIYGYNAWSRLAMQILTQKSKPRIDAVNQDFHRLVQILRQHNLGIDARLDVVTTLGGLGTPEVRRVLEDLLPSESDERMIGSIKYYLSMIDSQRKV